MRSPGYALRVMGVMSRTLQRIYYAIAMLRWSVLLAVIALHMVLSYVVFAATGETELVSDLAVYFYYYTTTATTVGYGDLSPQTDAGRTAAAIVVLPGSIALFTAVLGKAVSDIGNQWRRGLEGKGNYAKRSDHIVIVGWQERATKRLIETLLEDRGQPVRPILMAAAVAENPMPEAIDFVYSETLSDLDAYVRAGAGGAKSVLIRGANDDDTLAATLAARAAAPTAHIVVHMENEDTARLLEHQIDNIEVFSSISVDMMVRAANDPGASRLANLMFSSRTESTAFSLCVPDDTPPMAYIDALVALKKSHRITLIGVSEANGRHLDLNCVADRRIEGGDTLFYIANERREPTAAQWRELSRELA
ncbi:ion channel [Citromicrobium bathyomarinum]|uniref:ion channel n=1 Tax=Citromicrobium bathyomarinum TaxID=72174 RepID=UPI00315AEC81